MYPKGLFDRPTVLTAVLCTVQSHPAILDDQHLENLLGTILNPGQRGGGVGVKISMLFQQDSEGSRTTRSGIGRNHCSDEGFAHVVRGPVRRVGR